MAPRKYETQEAPHLEQFLLNRPGRDTPLSQESQQTSSNIRTLASSRITALIGTRHSRLDELGRELQHMIRYPSEVQDRPPSTKLDEVEPDWDKVMEEPEARQLVTNTKGNPTVRRYEGTLDEVSARLADSVPFTTPSRRKATVELQQSLGLRPPSYRTLRSTNQWLRERLHPFVVLKDTLDEIIRFGSYLLKRTASASAASKSVTSPPQSMQERIMQLRDDIVDVIVIERSALDDAATFLNSVKSELYARMGPFERLKYFVWENGHAIAANAINLAARANVLKVPEQDLSEMHTIRFFLRSLGRKYHNRHSSSRPETYVLIWVNRDAGWKSKSAVESPLFNSLVTHLSNKGYLRTVNYNVAFHLVIASRGDGRHVLDTLGVNPSGHDYLIQYLDPGPLPANVVQDYVYSYLNDVVKMNFEICFWDILWKELCEFERMGTSPTLDGNSRAFTRAMRTELLGLGLTTPPWDGRQWDNEHLLSRFYQNIRAKSLIDAVPQNNFIRSIDRFISSHVVPGQGSGGRTNSADSGLLAFEVDDWRCPGMLEVLVKTLEHISDEAAVYFAHLECERIIDAHFPNAASVLRNTAGLQVWPPWRTLARHDYYPQDWEFGSLLRQQINPILRKCADDILSDLDRVGYAEVAIRVAYELRQRSPQPRTSASTTGVRLMSTVELRELIGIIIGLAPPSSSSGAPVGRGKSGIAAPKSPAVVRVKAGVGDVDRIIAHLLAGDMLEAVFHPSDGTVIQGTDGTTVFRYIPRSYKIVTPYLLNILTPTTP